MYITVTDILGVFEFLRIKLVSVVMNFEETFLCNSFGGSEFATSGSYGLTRQNLHWRLTD
jgi:hypothetical protein